MNPLLFKKKKKFLLSLNYFQYSFIVQKLINLVVNTKILKYFTCFVIYNILKIYL